MRWNEAEWKYDSTAADVCDSLPVNTARSYFRDALLGLEYIHAQNIVHRDMKPEVSATPLTLVLLTVCVTIGRTCWSTSSMYLAKSPQEPAMSKLPILVSHALCQWAMIKFQIPRCLIEFERYYCFPQLSKLSRVSSRLSDTMFLSPCAVIVEEWNVELNCVASLRCALI